MLEEKSRLATPPKQLMTWLVKGINNGVNTYGYSYRSYLLFKHW